MSNNSQLSEGSFFTKENASDLEKIVEKYPWCSIAQLSLLQQYKKSNSPHFKEQAEKTALFFNNINWLNWQLSSCLREPVVNSIPERVPEKESENDISGEKIQPMLPKVPAKEIPSEELIAFEPLHTTDYFASQGIKISDESLINNKLDGQMKSFTEWLKSMKKIHKENLQAVDEQTNNTIQQIAEVSNADAEVVTEAMADILVRQNKTEKAIEVYTKLSLINPSKSAYFAGKIDELSA